MKSNEIDLNQENRDVTNVTSQIKSENSVKRKKSLSMHEDVPVWYDCCSCEAEPYWIELVGDPTTENNDKK